jgi:hypothetical protein
VRVEEGAPLEVTIVGTAILPLEVGQFDSGSGMAFDGLVEALDLAGISPLQPEMVVVDFASGAEVAAIGEALQAQGLIDEGFTLEPPEGEVLGVSLAGIDVVPRALGSLAGALAALVLAYLVASRVSEWRTELAVHRAIGFTSGQARRAIALASAMVALVVVTIGIPLGVAIGRVAWLTYASRLGVKPETAIPSLSLALVIVAAVALALAVSAVPAWLAGRRSPAVLLRAE